MNDDSDSPFRVVEVSDGRFFAGEIFRRKLGGTLPDYGRHLLAVYRHDPQRFTPLGYLNILGHGSVALVGGGCVDGRAFADIPDQVCRDIRESGGALYRMLRHAFTEMAADFEAFFGYCGDARAEEVDLQAGFRHTRHAKLLANYHRPLSPERRDQLLEEVFALGPF